jgi:DNA repair protein RadD
MHGISRLDAPAQALTQENFLDAALPIPRQLILRDYQSDLLHSLPYGPGNRTLMQLATGAGKTEIAMTWARLRNPTPARPLWFVVHTIELLRQTFWRFVRAGFDPGKLCFGEGEDGSKSIHICTIQTLTARQRRGVDFTPPAFIILDEAHHSAAQSFRIMLKRYPKAEVLGMTATPQRADGRALGDYFQKLILGPSTRTLIEQGYLSNFTYDAGVEPDLSTVETIGADFNAGQAAEAMEATLLIVKPWEMYNQFNLRGSTLVFCSTIEFSKHVTKEFQKAGILAAHIDCDTPPALREAIIEQFSNGEFQVLSNCLILTEGYDLPAIENIFIMRPTKSLVIYRQMIGRGLRPKDNGGILKIFDHVPRMREVFRSHAEKCFHLPWRHDEHFGAAGRVFDDWRICDQSREKL